MPTDSRCSAGPIPDCISSFGEPIAPDDTITSRRAWTVCTVRLLPLTICTPTARPLSTITFSACAFNWMVRLGRERAGLTKAVDAEERLAFSCVSW